MTTFDPESQLRSVCEAIAWSAYTTDPVGGNGAYGAGIGPRTVVDPAHPASIGDDHVTIMPLLTSDGRSEIPEGGMLVFRDNSGEEDLPIASVSGDGKTVTFDFSALEYSGLRFAHDGNAPVSCNAYGWAPDDVAAMLDTGNPLFMAAPTRKGTPVSMMQGGIPTYHIELQHIRKLFRAGPQKMNPNMWSKRTQHAGWAGIEGVEKAVLGNPKLRTDVAGPFATKIGQTGSSADVIVWDLQKFYIEQKDVWVYFAAADLIVTGIPENIG